MRVIVLITLFAMSRPCIGMQPKQQNLNLRKIMSDIHRLQDKEKTLTLETKETGPYTHYKNFKEYSISLQEHWVLTESNSTEIEFLKQYIQQLYKKKVLELEMKPTYTYDTIQGNIITIRYSIKNPSELNTETLP